MIIHYAACNPVYLYIDNYRISLHNEKLKGKKINAMLGLTSEGDQIILSPYNMERLVSTSDLNNLSMYLNLIDFKGRQTVNDLDLRQITSPPEQSEYLEIFLNQHFNLENSYISYKNIGNTESELILLYIFYQTRKFNKFNDEINGTFTISIDTTSNNENIKLSNYVDRTLSKLPIKQIITQMNYDELSYGYLDIIGKNGERLEYLPLYFINDYRSKEIYLDGIVIDFEKSFYCNRNIVDYSQMDPNDINPIVLTFIY